MNAQLNDLGDRLQRLKLEASAGNIALASILDGLITEVSRLDARLEKVEGTARRAEYTASCLANGIQPD